MIGQLARSLIELPIADLALRGVNRDRIGRPPGLELDKLMQTLLGLGFATDLAPLNDQPSSLRARKQLERADALIGLIGDALEQASVAGKQTLKDSGIQPIGAQLDARLLPWSFA